MKYLVGAVLCLSSICAFADCTAIGCTGPASELLYKLYPSGESDGRVYIMPIASDLANLDCTPISGVYVTLMKTHPIFNQIYASMLFSKATNATVTIRIKNGSPICEVQYMTLL